MDMLGVMPLPPASSSTSTRAPSAKRRRAVAAPIPLPPPVTTTTLPASPSSATPRQLPARPKVSDADIKQQYRTVITVSKKDFTLRLFKNFKVSKRYMVATGQPAYPTPSGRFQIRDKAVNPTWSVPNSPWAGELQGTKVAGGSAENPLKARWMGIGDGVGFHGTGMTR